MSETNTANLATAATVLLSSGLNSQLMIQLGDCSVIRLPLSNCAMCVAVAFRSKECRAHTFCQLAIKGVSRSGQECPRGPCIIMGRLLKIAALPQTTS